MNDLGTDILLERRHEFTVHGRYFTLYQPSLGITTMIKASLEGIGIDLNEMMVEPTVYLLPIVEKRPLDCCRIIALSACATRAEAQSSKHVNVIARHLRKWLSSAEIISLLLISIGNNRVGEWLNQSGIAKENERMRSVSACRKDGSPTFGGKTIFGQVIDPAMERYGWTYEYTVWGISYAALTTLLADRVTSIMLTDEERKKVPKHLIDTGERISGDDPANIEKMMRMTR